MTSSQPQLTLCELADPGIDGLESYSPFCLKVHRALQTAGLQYTRRYGRAPADFKRLNPTGQVPVLLIDGEPLADSTKILRRIDELTGALSAGLDLRQRAEAELWEELADTGLNGFVVGARWADADNWPRVRQAFFGTAPWFVQRLIAPKLRKHVLAGLVARDVWRQGPEACWQRFGATLDALEARAPERGFWLSSTISVADLGLFGQLHSLRSPLTPWQAAQIAQRPRLTGYLDRVNVATRARSTQQLQQLASTQRVSA